jgi:hypothetical protein
MGSHDDAGSAAIDTGFKKGKMTDRVAILNWEEKMEAEPASVVN